MIYILCLVIAIGFSGWYYVHEHHARMLVQLPPDHYDYYATNVEYTAFDEHGVMNRRYTSKKLQHFRRNSTTDFEHPIMTVHQENSPPWVISADHGQAQNNDEKITLWDHVRVQQANSKTHTSSLILTDRLYYLPKQQFASTDAVITYHQPGSSMQAQGMRAYLDQQRVQLMSNTRGRYAKPPVA